MDACLSCLEAVWVMTSCELCPTPPAADPEPLVRMSSWQPVAAHEGEATRLMSHTWA